jgi:hypothetical protein
MIQDSAVAGRRSIDAHPFRLRRTGILGTLVGTGTIASLLGGASLVGCQLPASSEAGQIGLAFTLPGGATVGSVSWTVFSSSSAVLASGTTDTRNPRSTPSFSIGLAPGVGDTVSMTAATSQGAICSGTSAPFDVTVGQLVSVGVSLSCGNVTTDAGVGSVVITGTLVSGDNCPVLTSWLASPLETASAGGTIDVSVTATDADLGEALSYAWTATAGSFANSAAPSTEYICGTAGNQTLTVTISDNHLPTACTVGVSLPPVTCL